MRLSKNRISLQQLNYAEIKKWADIPKRKWNDWHWQIQNAVRTVEELRDLLPDIPKLSNEDARALSAVVQAFEMKLTPHIVLNSYCALKSGDECGTKALLATFVPTVNEKSPSDNDIDSIGEELECFKPAPLLTNFYKSRVLLFVTNICSSYCRYCFRRRKVGNHLSRKMEKPVGSSELRKAIGYIKQNRAIKEVIISGGDPLTLSDNKLVNLLEKLREIDHIKVLRIDTKVLTTLPQRVTGELVKRLQKLKPIYVVGNFLHPVELTPEVLNATSSLIDVGIPVFSHTALLKDINDDAEIIFELMWNLYVNRIIPYYLIQFIPTKWTKHFRVPISRGLKIMENLHGRLSGIANPEYIVYLPEGAGKVPLLPNYLIEHTKEGYYFRNFEGKKVLYKEPIEV